MLLCVAYGGEAEEMKMAIVEVLRKEEGEATAERMLYAYYRLKTRFKNVKELFFYVCSFLVS